MDAPKAGLTQVGRNIQDALEHELVPVAQIREARAALLEAFTATGRVVVRGRQRVGWSGVAAVVAIVSVAVGAWSWLRRPLSFAVDGAAGRVGDAIEVQGFAPVPLAFSDGSSISLRAGARVRVLQTSLRGARVLLEGGEADVSVAGGPRDNASWIFEAGPFQLQVTGTKFLVGWEAATRTLTIAMSEGSLLVSGPCLAGARSLGGKSSLSLSCPPPESASSAKSAPGTPEAVNAHAATTEALLAVRQRLPRSAEAALAAFALGRIALEQDSDYEHAIHWFKIYLDELPNGPVAGEAVGLLMEAELRQGDSAAARVEAELYLSRFPEGPFAAEARNILGP